MSMHFPLKFILEDGVHVEINKTGNNTYDFTLTKKEGGPRHFTFEDDERTKNQIVESLDFDQLNAVRRFWLEKE
jgi:hypothetical protein